MPGEETRKEEEEVVRDFYKEGEDSTDDEHLEEGVEDDPEEAEDGAFVAGFDFFFGHSPQEIEVIFYLGCT